MRAVGIENALMIDASGYGQETGPIIENAKRILEADPNRNAIFSYHVYDVLGRNENALFSEFVGLLENLDGIMQEDILYIKV